LIASDLLPVFFRYYNHTTTAPKRGSKTSKTPNTAVILGPETDKLAPSSPPATYDIDTLPSPDPFDTPTLGDEIASIPTEQSNERITWSDEMVEALIEWLYGVFKDGKAADSGFKKEAFTGAAAAVEKVCTSGTSPSWDKCKNKWGDFKEKWKHWLVLSEMSGFGWNEEKEKYEAYDYVWENLNKSNPRIIWHKTHIMPHRDLLSEILHEAQATGKAAVSSNDLDGSTVLIDPRLLTEDAATRSPSISSTSTSKPKPAYNRSKKRVKADISDDEDQGTRAPPAKKVDLGYAISGLKEEMALGRKMREERKSDQEKAVQLLEKAYGNRLNTMVFIAACTFFEDEHKARSFLAITNVERRDRWLEINLNTELDEPSS
jgi:hypothetical protein